MSWTFWEHVYDLRKQGLIDRVWKTTYLSEHLEGSYAASTITVDPYNYSISREGDGIGYFVKRGEVPRAWRVGRGQFQLIADPDDDMETQTVERDRSVERAEEIRSRKKRSIGHHIKSPTPLPDRPDQPSPQPGAAPGSPVPKGQSVSASDRYTSISITLTESERQSLVSLTTEKKAEALVRKHLDDKYGGQARIQEDEDGVDLVVSVDGKIERIEVKGTESPTIAWQQLKVSSQKSQDALEHGDASMYRVVDVAGSRPRIYILTYGEHFTLEPELRWAVKRVAPEDDRYPLRGEPYRYDLPYDPVAKDEWKARE